MSLLNFIQPIHSTRPTNTSTHIPYRLTPCAKTLGALLFILSSTAAWASVDVEKKEGDRRAQAREMVQHLEYLKKDRDNHQSLHPDQRQKGKTEFLEGQIQQQYEQLQRMYPKEYDQWEKQQEQEFFRSLGEVAEKQAQTEKPNPSKATVSAKPKQLKAAATKSKAAPIPAPKPVPAIKDNPQIGSYIANQINAQKMFITDDLQHRQRETHYIDPITGEKKSTHMWLNTYNAKNRYNSGDKQLHTKSSRYAIQLGGPISKWSSGGNDQGLLGITAGFGRATSDSHAIESNRYARGTVEGYNLGLYHLWHANNDTQLGLYIDLLAQYSFFKNQARTQGLGAFTNYKSYLFTTALETGYKAQLFEKKQARLFVQPNAKVSWQRASGLQHYKATDAQVTIEESDSVATKLGIRTALEFDVDTLSAKALQVSPSFEANWMHDNGNKGAWLSHTYVAPQGNHSIAELKLGIEGKINSNLQLWTHVGQQFGHDKYSETQLTIGGNYHF
ncbi:autotransporter family protein [Yersinia mollaretii]|uniref:autotransporter family protein n=1 Tax=Yersinia mollaretii TaxID=33060 RepID=UPI0005DCE137|nr:autotransporter outer membrane beta-barrel domain-containing protein [Yersinia mollaretii]CQD42648.1 beta-barrel outer membrane protein [Yersinia mollaretii]CQH06070.1 beta-barrel outer membrane protein [Yersinia mollaretii]